MLDDYLREKRTLGTFALALKTVVISSITTSGVPFEGLILPSFQRRTPTCPSNGSPSLFECPLSPTYL